MDFIIILLGLIPLGAALLLQKMAAAASIPPVMLAAGFLLLWAVITLVIKMFSNSTRKALLINFLPAMDAILIAVTELVMKGHWPYVITYYSQLFFQPVIALGKMISGWSDSPIVPYAMCFVLLLAASIVGVLFWRERKKG
ncbi:MAG: hypothetical protein IJI05_03710 [Erysipelotrichaceae bacterium]|nr:hypothetical protein [Erysipelotrichaceae bacterium]